MAVVRGEACERWSHREGEALMDGIRALTKSPQSVSAPLDNEDSGQSTPVNQEMPLTAFQSCRRQSTTPLVQTPGILNASLAGGYPWGEGGPGPLPPLS